MSGGWRAGSATTRRRFLKHIASAAATASTGAIAGPAYSRANQRPVITHGVQSGDVSANAGMVWARADRPARLLIEVATTDSFKDVRHTAVVDALPESDFTAKTLIEDLPPGQDIFYRLRFQDLSSPTLIGEPHIGRFRTAPADRRSVSFLWSGDTAGQGWGIAPAYGGMRTYATMLVERPDFFIHCGDNIYADCEIPPELKLPNNERWRNIVTEEKSKPAETLADYRGNYKYNLLDDNLRAFNAEGPTFALWDNHEVMEWWTGESFGNGALRGAGERVSREKSALLLAARANRAFHEFMPLRPIAAEPGRVYRKIAYGPLLDLFLLDMRSYRGLADPLRAGSNNAPAPLLGPAQLAWLKRELARSDAVWRVIASDTPLGEIRPTPADARQPLGACSDIAGLLSFMRSAGIRNTLWLTADLHYTAAHHFNPNRAVFQDFEPFWEFVSGPIHAGTWTPSVLDKTFGLRVIYQNAASVQQGNNLAPCFGLQFFGQIAIDGATGILTVKLKDVGDRTLWSIELPPKIDQRVRIARPLPG